jgi:multiple sugar transport system permease protein
MNDTTAIDSDHVTTGLWYRIAKHRFEYVLLLPAIIIVLAVIFYPIIYAVDISLHETRFLEKGRFIGFDHYLTFFSNPLGWKIIWNSIVLVVGSLIFAVPIGLGLAILINMKIRLRAAMRAVLILPWVISQVITAMLWGWIANPQFGPVRVVTDAFEMLPIDFFGGINSAMASLIVVNVWRSFPFAMLLLLAALQTVPRELLEAAEADGASAWRRFWEVTFPLIQPTVMVVTIMLSLSYFNHIDLPLILTGGGPLNETKILALSAYEEAFEFNKIGYGSAISIIVFIVNMLLSLVYIRLLKSERHF